jgi:two-component system, NarL family, sensor kinase
MNALKQALLALHQYKTDTEMTAANIGLLNDVSGVATLIVTRHGRICEINHTAAALLGYIPAELVDRMLMPLLDSQSYDDMGSQVTEHRQSSMAHALGDSAERVLVSWLSSPTASSTTHSFKLRSKYGQLVPLHMAAHSVTTRDGELAERMALIWAKPEQVQQEVERSLRTQAELQQLTDKLMAVQEKERKRLAQELHDGMAQALTMIKFTLEEAGRALEIQQHERAQMTLRNSIDLVREALDDARRIAQDLWPSSLDNLGLLPTIGAYCRQFTDAQPQISISNDLFVREHEVPQSLRVDIFRVMQECLRNVAQHAKAKSVRVILRITSEGLLLTVKDDGAGFDAERLYYGPTCLLGIGLRSMRERLHTHQGQLQVQSRVGEGTTIAALWRLPSGYAAAGLKPNTLPHDEELQGLSPFAARPVRKARRSAARVRTTTDTVTANTDVQDEVINVIKLKRSKMKAA